MSDKVEKKIVDNKTSADYLEELKNSPSLDKGKAISEIINGGGFVPIVDRLMKSYTPPAPQLSPEEERKARFSASLSDGLASLAEMFAHGRGAYVRNRQGNSSTKTTNARLKEIQDKYERDRLRYEGLRGGMEQFTLGQMLKGKQDAYNNERKLIEIGYQNARAEEQAAAKWEQDMAKQQTKALYDANRDANRHKNRLKEIDRRGNYTLKAANVRAMNSPNYYRPNPNLFEIPAGANEAGSYTNPYTQQQRKAVVIPPEQRRSMLTSLGDLNKFIQNNKLYKTKYVTDNDGAVRKQSVPFSEDEIIQWGLDNGVFDGSASVGQAGAEQKYVVGNGNMKNNGIAPYK